MTKSTEERARRACFEECSAGVHLDFEAGCCTVCKAPSECQSWRAYLSPTGGEAMTAPELLPCPFCGSPAHRITPMGYWKPGGYTPNGVRYVCGSLYADPPVMCPGTNSFYSDDADAEAIAAWNRRTPLPDVAALIAEARLEERERCAGIADVKMTEWARATYQNPEARMQNAAKVYAAGEIAEAIRALKEETP